MNLIKHLERQKEWSERTFGPGDRTRGVLDHIRKELVEIEEAKGTDLYEWVDVVILALDGAWRAGFTPVQISNAICMKQATNEQRQWPDWRTAAPDKAIEHVKKKAKGAMDYCPECGKPHSECDPEGVGHYRG